MTSAIATTIDVRQIPPRERHPLIFSSFDALQPGQSLLLVNDHDPQPLRGQFEALVGGRYDWSYVEAGPALWRVQIGKKADADSAARRAGAGSCCSGGSCG